MGNLHTVILTESDKISKNVLTVESVAGNTFLGIYSVDDLDKPRSTQVWTKLAELGTNSLDLMRALEATSNNALTNYWDRVEPYYDG